MLVFLTDPKPSERGSVRTGLAGGFLKIVDTPRKTNMSPENQWLEDVFPIKNSPFLADMLVFRGVFLVPKTAGVC